MIPGHATPEGTTKLAEKFSLLQYNPFGKTGLMASQAGFGSYRVDVMIEPHHDALRKALLNGINVIDTSANYSDGGSEQLIGSVLQELISEKKVARESIIVVSKGGYIQGQNLLVSNQRKDEGNPFPELVEFDENLEHCIHPEFLADQITRSLERLNLQTIDGYLLHNPEYYLVWCQQQGVPIDEARDNYYDRIRDAFDHLEEEVAEGRIRFYGISSNTFPASEDSYEWTSLDRLPKKPNFKVIQFPMNLLEGEGITLLPADGLAVMINRPLNAIVDNRLIRLADSPAETGIPEEEIQVFVQAIFKLEELFFRGVLAHVDDSTNIKWEEIFSVGKSLLYSWREFESAEHWKEILNHDLLPRVERGVHHLTQSLNEEVKAWVEAYLRALRPAFHAVTRYYKQLALERTSPIKEAVRSCHADWASADSLSRMALRALRTTQGITTTLVGMRRAAYVDDVLAELSQPVATQDHRASWAKLNLL